MRKEFELVCQWVNDPNICFAWMCSTCHCMMGSAKEFTCTIKTVRIWPWRATLHFWICPTRRRIEAGIYGELIFVPYVDTRMSISGKLVFYRRPNSSLIHHLLTSCHIFGYMCTLWTVKGTPYHIFTTFFYVYPGKPGTTHTYDTCSMYTYILHTYMYM